MQDCIGRFSVAFEIEKAALKPPFLLTGVEDELESLNVLSLPALGSLDHIELNGLAFLKRTEAVALDRGVVDEYVLAAVAAQKAESLCIVKPLNCSLFHNLFLLLQIFNVPLKRNVVLFASRAV
jgi:hypothetical protein